MLDQMLKELSSDEAFKHIETVTKNNPMRLAGSTGLKWIPTIILGHDGSGGHVPNEYSEIEEVMFTTRAYLHTILEYFNVE